MPLTEKYRLAFELSPLPLLLISGHGKIRLANDEWARMFEYETADLVGQPVEILLPEGLRRDHPGLRDAFGRFPAKRQMGRGRDLQGQTRTGRLIPLDLGLHPVETEDDGVWTIVTAIDTSERVRGEALVRATLDASASAMVMVGRTGDIISVNQAALDLFGYGEDALLGEPVEVLLPLELRKAHRVYRNSFFEVSEARAMGSDAQLYGRHKDGQVFRIEAALTPVMLGDETLVLATIVDLSERMAAERAAAEKQAAEAQADKLARLNDDLTRFTYSASHDLKAPLSTISGMLNLCIADLRAGEVEEVIGNLQNLLDLAKTSAGKVESILKLSQVGHENAPVEEIDLDALGRKLWHHLSLAETDPPRLDIAIDLDAAFFSVRNAIEVILENLISNAIRYSDVKKPEQWIKLTARQDREWVEISVKDNGIGMSEDARKDVFGMFARFSDRSGHGIGMAIVARQVDQLGGSINCLATLGEGTEFVMRLPARG